MAALSNILQNTCPAPHRNVALIVLRLEILIGRQVIERLEIVGFFEVLGFEEVQGRTLRRRSHLPNLIIINICI